MWSSLLRILVLVVVFISAFAIPHFNYNSSNSAIDSQSQTWKHRNPGGRIQKSDTEAQYGRPPKHHGFPHPYHNPNINQSPDFLRGLNIGGWLVLEKWLTPSIFSGLTAIDQWTFDSQPLAAQRLDQHWSTYFTQSDVQQVSRYGINAIRIPIGFWAYDNAGTPYQRGADAYLEKAIGWAKAAGLKVWIDLHGAPGGQNGFDHSGHAGPVEWQIGNNMQRTTSILQSIASKYGTIANSDVVIGIELLNEPISWAPNNFTLIQAWTQTAYAAVRSAAENKNLQIIMHDAFQTATSWSDALKTMSAENGKFAIDTHHYQLYSTDDNKLNQDQHVQRICDAATSRFKPWSDAGIPLFVGEWSANTNVCVNPDGSTLPGTSTSSSCIVSGCQCIVDTDPLLWSAATKAQVGRFVDAQLGVFEARTSGYFLWNWKGAGVWGFQNGIDGGWIPNPITSWKARC